MLPMVSQLVLLGLLAGLVHGDIRPQDERRRLGLKFGREVADHVLVNLDMHPLQDAFSVCSWIKRIPHSAPYQYWFGYGSSSVQNEILIRNDGVYWIFNQRSDFTSYVTHPDEKWRHHCVTWDFSSKKFKVYYEGNLIGTVATSSSRKLDLGGKFALGNIVRTSGAVTAAEHAFGGEMYKLNVFNKALTGIEVKQMADDGLCSDTEEQYGLTRYIRWEDLLLKERPGNVTEIEVGCDPSEKHSIWDVLYDREFYNKVLTRDILNTLRNAWDPLEHFVGSTISDGFINHFKYDCGPSKCDED